MKAEGYPLSHLATASGNAIRHSVTRHQMRETSQLARPSLGVSLWHAFYGTPFDAWLIATVIIAIIIEDDSARVNRIRSHLLMPSTPLHDLE